MTNRNRLIYFCLIIIVIFLGICSRKLSNKLPGFISEYSGDTLWALMIFFIFGFILSRLSTLKIALMALTFSYLIELSQLYQAEWINSLRNTGIGGLILGYGFLWSDLICYTTGIIIGICIEKFFLNKFKLKRN